MYEKKVKREIFYGEEKKDQEPSMGIEPMAFFLPRRCSTTEPRRRESIVLGNEIREKS